MGVVAGRTRRDGRRTRLHRAGSRGLFGRLDGLLQGLHRVGRVGDDAREELAHGAQRAVKVLVNVDARADPASEPDWQGLGRAPHPCPLSRELAV